MPALLHTEFAALLARTGVSQASFIRLRMPSRAGRGP
jgi:hypothetical protein